jgi:hypothetical protein
LLGSLLSNLLEICPVFANLGELLDLVVLDHLVGLEQLDGLIELINLKGDVVLLFVNFLGVLHHFSEHLNILEVLLAILGVDVALEITEISAKHFNLTRDIVLHQATSHGVGFGITTFNEHWLVGRSSERLHHILVV